MRRKTSGTRVAQRGSVLLLEMLIVVSILGILLAMSAPSFMRMRLSQQANQAVSTLRSIQNAEAYYLQIYHNGYVAPSALAGSGVALPTTCAAPLLLGGAQAQTQANGYSFDYTAGLTPATLGAGCTTAGTTTFTLTANPISGPGRSFFTDESGVLRYADSGPADSSSPAWTW